MDAQYGTHTEKNQVERIEKVQKNAARYVTNNYSFTRGSTKTNMEQLGWIPLSEQRAKCKITTLYKSLNNQIIIPIDQCNMYLNRRITRQSGHQTFSIPQSNIDSHLHSFFPSTIRMWNKLSSSTKSLQSIEAFKSTLNQTTIRCEP